MNCKFDSNSAMGRKVSEKKLALASSFLLLHLFACIMQYLIKRLRQNPRNVFIIAGCSWQNCSHASKQSVCEIVESPDKSSNSTCIQSRTNPSSFKINIESLRSIAIVFNNQNFLPIRTFECNIV